MPEFRTGIIYFGNSKRPIFTRPGFWILLMLGHIRVLKEAELVSEMRDGVRRIYAINREGLTELRDYFERFWDEALDMFKRSLEGSDS